MISVIIPAFNADRFVADAIRSILAQSYRPLEIIVIDDGSTDRTAEVATSFGAPVSCISGRVGGISAARNAGLARAQGELIAFLDADDLWTPDKIARQWATLRDDASLEAVFGHVQQVRFSPSSGVSTLGPVLAGQTPSTMLIRREALDRVGHFNAEVPLAEAVEWYGRAQVAGLRHVVLPDVVLHRRIHDQNVGVLHKEEQVGQYLKVLRATLERKRGTTP